MGQIAGPLMMAAGTGLDIYGKLKAGKDAKEQAYKAAELRVQEAGMIAGMTQERLHDLEREKYYAVGAARALGAHAGVKVGTGSMLTQEKAIEGAYRRKQEILAKETGYRRSKLWNEAEELKRMGRKAKKSSAWSAGASLLTGGYDFGKTMGWKGFA